LDLIISDTYITAPNDIAPPQGGNSTETSHYLINIPIFILNSTALRARPWVSIHSDFSPEKAA